MKRLISVILVIVLLVGLLSTGIFAASDSYVPMTTSQSMVDIIKDFEGFVSQPYSDGSQWSIGYGTFCGSTKEEVPVEYWDGITEEHAEELLRDYLTNVAEAELNDFYMGIGRQPTQQQFDAMIDFTYNLGSSWMHEDSKVKAYLKNYTTETENALELVNVLGAWCRVGGQVTDYLCSRRIREALIYLHGDYYLPYGDVESDLPLVSGSQLPHYKYVIYNGNGVGISTSGYEDTVAYLAEGSKYGSLLTPVSSGKIFAGWYRADGSVLLAAHQVRKNEEVKADWVQLSFTDITAEKWYATAVAYCYKHGYMVGTDATTFSPSREITRAMLVAVLYSMAGKPEVSGSVEFSDVKAGAYYEKAVIWAKANGITAGYTDGTFRPSNLITRAEMVAMLYAYAEKIAGLDVSGRSDVSRFEDAGTIPGYAVEKFGWALNVGLISGTTASTLSPVANATRAQLAQEVLILTNMK